jgi:hypothetical protein
MQMPCVIFDTDVLPTMGHSLAQEEREIVSGTYLLTVFDRLLRQNIL